ncbi:MAG: carboxypeptidase regulatory-like domain-containing protein [Gammaproteobacteria bacterium]
MNTLTFLTHQTSRPNRRAVAWLAAIVATLFSVSGFAQETTGALRGNVVDASGNAVAGVPVEIIDGRTGSSRNLVSNAAGNFTAIGLRVGGPYSVEVSPGQFARQTVNQIFIQVGEMYTFRVVLQDSSVEEVVVSAATIQSAAQALGPSSSFDLNDLQTAPAINRDIKDLIRIDPRIYIDEAFQDSIQCAGANSRFNSLTVDGVRLNDNFGLNSNGYPTERIPFSFDSIEQIAVELAPFDVQYGGFTACNINAVSKSGTNEFHGSVFWDYTDDSLRADSLNGDSINVPEFDEQRYGVSLGGPIIKDKLWFFASYEKLAGVDTFDRGAEDSNAARQVIGVTQANIDEISDIANNVYGYDPGGIPTALDVEDEKITVKLDWDISDNHRAALSYNYNDGFSISQADGDNNELEFQNHLYERGAELTSVVGQVFSNWGNVFSTEVRISQLELDNRQLPLAGTDFGEVQIDVGDATVYLGADDSRHANKLNYDLTAYKFKGNLLLQDHSLSFGYEREEFDVFNLFIQEAEGEYRFSSIDDFRNGTPNRITYENAAPSNNVNDAAAQFGYEINTLYVQDEYTFANADLTVVAGLRYDGYTSDDAPTNNQNFSDRYGFTNTNTFDGEGLIQPRVGFDWQVNESVSVHGGVGLYAGGNPNVWLSNNYSNNGITQVEVQDRSGASILDPGFAFTGAGRPIFDIPQDLFDAVAGGTADSGVNALDPDFEIPSEWKFALGAVFDFDLPGGLGSGYTLALDALISRQNDAAIIQDITLAQIGTAPDGRPLYRGVDLNDPGCRVDPSDRDNCGSRSQDFLLTNVNGSDGGQQTYSFALSKAFDWGLDWTLGYAYNESDDVSPMTSSVAFSNFTNLATSDPNNPGSAQSNYEIPNRITLRLNYERAFFGDNLTKITLFGTANEGRPFSYTFDDGFVFGDFAGFGRNGRQLLYVPTGPDDPLVNFNFDQATQDAFFNFLQDSGLNQYAGEIAPRNALHSDWWTKFDLRIEQEFPGVRAEHKFAAFMIIENLGNLLNDEWGVLREAGFPRYQSVIDATIDANTNTYNFDRFIPRNIQGRDTDASSYEIRFGFRYDF